MDKSDWIILGLLLGLGIGVSIGIHMSAPRTSQGFTQRQVYNNEERWEIIKDSDGRVKEVVVHRSATEGG